MLAKPNQSLVKPNKSVVRTKSLDRLFLCGTVALVPMQANLPTFGGVGVLFVVFMILIIYQLMIHTGAFIRTAQHPVFLTGYAFLGIAGLFETLHGNSAYSGIIRIGFMLIGGVIIASLCRDRRALVAGMYGYVLGAVVLSFLLVFTTHEKLSASEATGDYMDASVQRKAVFAGNPLKDDLNTMSFFAAEGAIVATALALGKKHLFQRYLLFGFGAICMAGTFIPMSRSGLLILVISLAVIVYRYGIMRPQVILAVGGIAVTTLLWMPSIMWDRMTVSTERQQVTGDYEDSRVHVYGSFIKYLPEYVITGVGEGNFFGKWGEETDFANEKGKVVSAHNSFARVTINWGVMGLVVFLMLIWQAYRCLRKGYYTDPLHTCLLALGVAVFLWLLFIDTLEAKEFSLGLGFLVATDLWVWSRRQVTKKATLEGKILHSSNRRGCRDTQVFSLPAIKP